MTVYSGNASTAPIAQTGVLQRFAAKLDEKGSTHFHGRADLRMVVPGEARCHQRTFFPSSAYSAIGIRVLRKADGTGLVALVPDAAAPGARLDQGQYRMQFTCLRDNHGVDPTSQVLSQGGHTDPEVVLLDIPWNQQRK